MVYVLPGVLFIVLAPFVETRVRALQLQLQRTPLGVEVSTSPFDRGSLWRSWAVQADLWRGSGATPERVPEWFHG